jgi:hypothetical protein
MNSAHWVCYAHSDAVGSTVFACFDFCVSPHAGSVVTGFNTRFFCTALRSLVAYMLLLGLCNSCHSNGFVIELHSWALRTCTFAFMCTTSPMQMSTAVLKVIGSL